MVVKRIDDIYFMRYICSMKTAPFSMRLDAQLKAQLQRLADRERRSLTNLIEKVLADYVERERIAVPVQKAKVTA